MVLIVPEKVKLSVPIPFVTATPPFTVTNPENVVDNAVDVATPTRDKKFCVPYKKVINELVAKNTGLYIIPLKYSVGGGLLIDIIIIYNYFFKFL